MNPCARWTIASAVALAAVAGIPSFAEQPADTHRPASTQPGMMGGGMMAKCMDQMQQVRSHIDQAIKAEDAGNHDEAKQHLSEAKAEMDKCDAMMGKMQQRMGQMMQMMGDMHGDGGMMMGGGHGGGTDQKGAGGEHKHTHGNSSDDKNN